MILPSPSEIQLPSWLRGTAKEVRTAVRKTVSDFFDQRTLPTSEMLSLEVAASEDRRVYLKDVPVLLPKRTTGWRLYLLADEIVAHLRRIGPNDSALAAHKQLVAASRPHFWLVLGLICAVQEIDAWLAFAPVSPDPETYKELLRHIAFWLPELVGCGPLCIESMLFQPYSDREAWAGFVLRAAGLAGMRGSIPRFRTLYNESAARFLIQEEFVVPTAEGRFEVNLSKLS